MASPPPRRRQRIAVTSLEEIASDDTEALAKICQIDDWHYGEKALDLSKIQHIFRGGCTSFYVARSGKEIVAYAMIHFFPSTPGTAELGRLVVHPELRRAQVATQLLNRWTKHDGPRGRSVLNANLPVKNLGGCAFLESVGFKSYYHSAGHEPREFFQWIIPQ